MRLLALARLELPRASVRSGSCTGRGAHPPIRPGGAARTRDDLRLKLAARAEVLRHSAPDVDYLDVAVPDRPVAGVDSEAPVQVEGSADGSR